MYREEMQQDLNVNNNFVVKNKVSYKYLDIVLKVVEWKIKFKIETLRQQSNNGKLWVRNIPKKNTMFMI